MQPAGCGKQPPNLLAHRSPVSELPWARPPLVGGRAFLLIRGQRSMVSWIGDQRNESAAGQDPRLRLAADLVGLIKGLLGRRAERTDENAAFAELLPQRRRT